MRHGSLFSGGGGFDLAAEMVGWENVFHCEKDTFCQIVLKHYWPDAETISDIKEFDGTRYRGAVDVISGGFPCQPFSTAGKRKGTEDDRYLWPEMLRVIREIEPRWVVGENVHGLINWNGGMVFEQVQLDLEAEGYDVATYVLPAAGINAPHQRYRVWIVAHNAQHDAKRKTKDHTNTCRSGRAVTKSGRKVKVRRNNRKRKHLSRLCEAQLAQACTNTHLLRCKRLKCKDAKHPNQRREHAQYNLVQVGTYAFNTNRKRSEAVAKIRKLEGRRFSLADTGKDWRDWPTQSPLCSGDDGLPDKLDGIAFRKWRRNSIKMFGNAIVPQIAERIFRTIKLFEEIPPHS